MTWPLLLEYLRENLRGGWEMKREATACIGLVCHSLTRLGCESDGKLLAPQEAFEALCSPQTSAEATPHTVAR